MCVSCGCTILGPGNHGSGVVKTGTVLIFFEAKTILVFHWPSRFEFFATREVLTKIANY